MRGIVKWFDIERGYGFITPDDGDKDLFVHYTAVDTGEEFRALYEGQVVEFDLEQTDKKGPRATHVKIIEDVPHSESKQTKLDKALALLHKVIKILQSEQPKPPAPTPPEEPTV